MADQKRGIEAFERLARGDDTGTSARGACKKCNGIGHLTYECKNTIKIDAPRSNALTNRGDRFAAEKAKLRAEIEALKAELNGSDKSADRSSKDKGKRRRDRSPSLSPSPSECSSDSASDSDSSDTSTDSSSRRNDKKDKSHSKHKTPPRHRHRRRSYSPSSSGTSSPKQLSD
ncbi:hypothetical protein EV175_004420 [Coemansia sp. RSA 1933]|nr:hypothetical protein EV175_004420 [Coemansia sp. RSA 1933]